MHSERFKRWMDVERMRILMLDIGDNDSYEYLTSVGKRIAKEMHFKFPRSPRGKAYG